MRTNKRRLYQGSLLEKQGVINKFIEILTKESKIYFDIKIKEFTNNPKNIGPFELLKTVVGYELHMAGVAVDKLGDKYPNVAKGANKVIEIIKILVKIMSRS